MRLIRAGDVGPEVLDVQRRLEDLGLSCEDTVGEFGAGTRDAVRTFQQRRGLVADGLVGPDTWLALVEAGYALGDRLLYLTRPMLRGDDVRELQRRLGQLGFDAGHDDGIFGPDTASAVSEFQVNVGLAGDGKAGAETMAALRRLHRRHQEIPAATIDERHLLRRRHGRPSLTGARLLIDAGNSPDDPGFLAPDGTPEHVVTWAIANRVHGRLAARGAHPVLSRGPTTSPSSSERAQLANREEVEAILSIHTNGLDSPEARGVAAYYFGSGASVSELGRQLAEFAVHRITTATGTPSCRTHPTTAGLVRESRAPAVVVEVGFLTHPVEGRALTTAAYQGTIADCLVDALTRFLVEVPASVA